MQSLLGRDRKSESEQPSDWARTALLLAWNVWVVLLVVKYDSACDYLLSSTIFFSQDTFWQKLSVSDHQGKTVILWHFVALHQPLNVALCSLSSVILHRHSQSFTPLSVMVPLKRSLRTQPIHPLTCVSPQCNTVMKLQLSSCTVICFRERGLTQAC